MLVQPHAASGCFLKGANGEGWVTAPCHGACVRPLAQHVLLMRCDSCLFCTKPPPPPPPPPRHLRPPPPLPVTCARAPPPPPFPSPVPQVLANKVRGKVAEARATGRPLGADDGFCSSTSRLLNRFLESKPQAPQAGAPHNFPPGLRQ